MGSGSRSGGRGRMRDTSRLNGYLNAVRSGSFHLCRSRKATTTYTVPSQALNTPAPAGVHPNRNTARLNLSQRPGSVNAPKYARRTSRRTRAEQLP